MLNKLRFAFTLIICFLGLFCSAQFNFGSSVGFGLSQVEKDNLRGFKKIAYEVGLIGGYEFKSQNQLLVEMKYSVFGSKRGQESVRTTFDSSLAELNLSSFNVFLGGSFRLSNSWSNESKYRFIGGLRFHNVVNSSINLYKPSELINESDSFDWLFCTMRFGPGMVLTENFVLDLVYEHKLFDIKYDQPFTEFNKLVPFQLFLTLSYYI